MEDLDPDRFFRCDDMALVTFLKTEGHTAQRVKYDPDRDTCYWFFLITDSLLDEISAFGSRDALVEPRDYSKMFASTRSELFQAKDSVHQ